MKKTQWIAMEKIHGSNFTFVTDGEIVRCAKRRSFLNEEDDFFNWQVLFATQRDRILQLFTRVKHDNPETFIVCIYGELFGCSYPADVVAVDPDLHAVQTGIYYSPALEYCAFDLAIAPRPSGVAKLDCRFLDYDYALPLFKEVGLFCAEPLITGTYEQCLEFNIKFRSTISGRLELGRPLIPDSIENFAEGVVIKPLKEIMVKNAKGSDIRAIVKKKIKEFAEDSRYDEAEKWPAKDSKAKTGVSNVESLKWEVPALVNENRLNNAVSKIGRIRSDDKVRLEQLKNTVVNDVLDELRSSSSAPSSNSSSSSSSMDAIEALSSQDLANLTQYIRDEVETLLAEVISRKKTQQK